MDKPYSVTMANALGRKLGDLESRLILSFPNQDNFSNRRVKEIEDEQWRGTKTVEDIEQCINRLEEVVFSKNDDEYYQMLLLFYRAFIAVKKISIIDPNISNCDIDKYFDKLESLFDEMNSKWNLQAMKD